MTNFKHTKHALVSTVLSIVLCVSMLVGTTFAWFTDSVTSANNVIQSGNLDIVLEYWTGTEWKDVTGSSDILTGDKWEPGYTDVAYLRFKNAGSLALKYQLGVKINSEKTGKNGAGETIKLSDYIYYDVVDMPKDANDAYVPFANRDAALAAVNNAAEISKNYTKTGELLKGSDYVYLAMVVYMPTTVGNEANHNGVDIPQIDLGINIFATQLGAESDSFGSDYDNKAPILNAPETLPATGNMNLQGSAESKVNVTVPAAVVDELKGMTGVTGLGVAASAPVADTTNNTVTFEAIDLVDQNGKVIDLAGQNLPAKVTVTLPVGDVFADGTQVAVYHDGEFVTYVTVAGGEISYEVAHFCEVTVKALEDVVAEEEINLNVTPKDGVLVIENAMQFLTFAKAVNAGNTYKGVTVQLAKDIDLAGISWEPIGNATNAFQGTFDGNNKTIKNLEVRMAGKSNVGLFGKTTDGTIKNVTVENAIVVGRLAVGVVAGTPYTSKYENITVKGHVEVEGMAYVGGVGGRNAYANWNNITVAVDETSYVNANSVENGTAYRTYVGGVIGFMGEGGHKVSNVTSNINVIGSTIDVGGVVGIAHYGNNFENVACSGNVTVTGAEDATDADEIGGIAGVWYNQDGVKVTFTNCTFTGKLEANQEADLYNNTIVGKAYNKTGNGILVVGDEEYVAVNTADELVAALEEQKNVLFVDNIKIDPANMSNAYGTTGINVTNGQTIDGNGYTLDIKGAGGTWDSGINTTGGIIRNIKVTGSFRGIFVNHNSTHSETVVLDNVTLEGVVYTISCDQGMNQNLVATNCTFNGWTSFAATLGNAKFENCSFGKGNGYAYCRPYAPTEFVNCEFEAGYTLDPRAAVTFEGCTLAKVAITADNVGELVTDVAKVTVK